MPRRKGQIRIGTSGWHYAHWLGIFYPEGTKPAQYFQYYRRWFDTVEMNNPFYRMPSPDTVDAWRAAAPDDFLFAVKANRSITHTHKLSNVDRQLADYFAAVERFGPTLGPILFQLPPRWKFNAERLQEFLARLPGGMKYVMEFREPSWFNDACYRLLREHNVALCIHDMGGNLTPMQVTAPLIYIRFHGRSGHYGGDYDQDSLNWWAKQVRHWSNEGYDVCGYFNNDAEGFAPRNAHDLRRLLGQADKPLEVQKSSPTMWDT
jgi:uncharacterized protein YecE (DUF72 family)